MSYFTLAEQQNGNLQQPSSKSTVLASDSSAEKPKPLDRVEPGTLLEEANFKKTLRETGSKLVVVQVYLDACGPCITEALKLTQMKQKWHSQGVWQS